MAAIHNEHILKACQTLNPGESYVFKFDTAKIAHNEYCYFRTALRACIQKFPAAKSLTISRSGLSVCISMGVPAVFYPTPSRVKTSSIPQEESQNDLSPIEETPDGKPNPYQHVIDRINSDLADGLISPDDAAEAISSLSICNPSQEL